MRIERSILDSIGQEINQALKAIGARHGFDVKQKGGITYDETHFNIKHIFSDCDVDMARKEFEKKCWKYGFSASDYQKTFGFEGKTIIIMGVNTRAPKYPINYLVDGKPMKCSPSFMKIMLSKAD